MDSKLLLIAAKILDANAKLELMLKELNNSVNTICHCH